MAGGLALVSILLAALVRPFLRGLVAALLPVVAVAVWWASIPPSNTRDWAPDVARTARATFDGSRVTIENVRNFKYRSESDYDQRWETRTYNLDRIRGVDLFLSFWGPTQIAHTIVSWEFDDGQHLAISIETRKEKGESYSALRGFFRQYELYYVVADERDLVGLRTNYRGEQVYLYRIRVPASQARALLVDYLNEVNRLADHPRVVQRVDAELHDYDPRPCAKRWRGRTSGLEAARQRPPRSAPLRTGPDRHEICPSQIFEHAATSPKEQKPPTTLPIFPPASARSAIRTLSPFEARIDARSSGTSIRLKVIGTVSRLA